MTVRKVWLGSTGPFLYDDSVLYIDEDGVISPDNQQAIATDGQIVVQSPPSSPVHIVRKQDLDDAIGDISSLEARVTSLEATVSNHGSRLNALESKFFSSTFTMTYEGWVDTPSSILVGYAMSDRFVAIEIPALDSTSNQPFVVYGNLPAPLIGTLGHLGQVIPAFTDSTGWIPVVALPSSYFPYHIEIKPLFLAGGLWPVTGRKLITSNTLLFALI